MSSYPKVIVTLFMSFWLLIPWARLWAAEVGISFNTATHIPVWNEVFSIQRENEQDGYLKIHLNQGDGVALSIKAIINSGSQYIQIYQPDNINTAFTSTARSYGATVATSFTAAVTGTYWLRIRGTDGNSEIAVYRAFYNPDVTDSDRSFFSSFNTARYFSPGEYVLTELPYFFRFEAREGDDIAMSLTPKIASGFQRIEIFQPSNLFSSISSSSVLSNNNTGIVSFKAQTSGVYYARITGAVGQFVLNAQGVRADLDDDGDGLSNTVELARGTRIDIADTNSNGLSDLQSARLGLQGVFEKEYSRSDLSEARSVHFALLIPYSDKPFSVDHDGSDRFFALVLREGEGVTIELNAKVNSGSQRFSIIQPDDLERSFTSSNSASEGNPSALSFTAAVAGTYYIRLGGAVGRAELAIYNAFFNPDNTDSSREYNNDFYTAKYLVSGKFLQNAETSVHRFVAKVGDQISISLTPIVNAGTQRLRLYQPGVFNSSFLATNALGNNSTGNLSFIARTDGVYFAEVSGAIGAYNLVINGERVDSDTDNDGLTDSVEWFRGSRYDLADTNGSGVSDLVQARQGSFGLYTAELTRFDVRNADSLLSAMPIPYFDKPFTVRHNGNDCFFSMTLQAGEGITISLSTRTNLGSMSLAVYQPDSKSSNIANIRSTPNNDINTTSFTANVTGTYFFKLDGVVGIAEIAVYRAFFNPNVDDASRSFFNTFNTSEYLKSGTYSLAALDCYHRFEAQIGDEITVILTGGANVGSQRLDLFRPESEFSIRSSTSVPRDQVVSLSFIAQSAGVYYVRVSGERGTYHLGISGVRPDADDDRDGLSNTAELVRGTRLDVADTNNNGLSDYHEALNGRLGIYPVQYSRSDMSLANSFLFAKSIPYKDKPFSIAFDGDHRYFEFDAIAGEDLTITLTSRIFINILSYQYLEVYSPVNQTSPFLGPITVRNGDTGVVSFKANASGKYFIRLRGVMGGADLAVYNAFTNAGVQDSQRNFYGSFNTARLLVSGTYIKQETLIVFFVLMLTLVMIYHSL
ncbi:pre-peptidase C-terminal domain-containing protein [Alishewanella longhuensis]